MDERLLSQDLVLAFDTETTGVDPEEARIVELGLCYFRAGELVETVNIRINPDVPIPEGASEVHKIYDADVAECPKLADIEPEIGEHMSGVWAANNIDADGRPPILSGYNAQHYDAPLVNAELKRIGSELRIDPELVVDPIWAARFWGRHATAKLEPVCEAFGIHLDNAHAAWADAAATGHLLHRLVVEFWIRDPVNQALADLATWRARDQEDRDRWVYYLYTDRRTGELRVGFGKHQGRLLADLPQGSAAWYANNLDGMPENVKAIFEAHARGQRVKL